jgi:5-dehydro-2-deoxygluconokinase
MVRGFNSPLYILPFDHRGSFETKMFGWSGALTPEQTAEIAAAKRVIYDGFLAAVAARVPKSRAGILVDEQFGQDILKDAQAHGFITACPVEKSGQEEFDFEYGDQFAQHLQAVRPTFAKVLVRYNPAGDKSINQRQAERLRILSDYLQTRGESLLMFELLVPPEPFQGERAGASMEHFDHDLRPQLMVEAIMELQDAGVEPALWKIEGLDRAEDCARIVAAARRDHRDEVSCIVLGRGENDEKVDEWLTVAAGVPGFVGFAVGRTVFWKPLVEWRSAQITRAEAVERIAGEYSKFAAIFETGRSPRGRGAG